VTPSADVFARRLRDARKRAGMTQERLAAAAGIDEFSASARISQYETGKHIPQYGIARNLAKALRVPVEYLYAGDDRTAEMLLHWARLTVAQKTAVLEDMKKRL
jgi:transcriptional regulator with XRE-family HTH domain